MDRLIWQVSLVFIILNSAVYGQSPGKKVWVEYDTVTTKSGAILKTKVCMTPEKFAYYYVVEKNLNAIHDSIPSLVKGIEAERSQREKEVSNLEKTIVLKDKQKDVLQQSIDDCTGANTKLNLKNIKLQDTNDQLKKDRYLFGAGGILLGILISIAL